MKVAAPEWLETIQDYLFKNDKSKGLNIQTFS